VGGLTVEMVKRFKFDYSVLGCSAIDADGDMLDFDDQEIMVTNKAIDRSRNVMVVADQSKFERKAPLTICSLADVAVLFTDGKLPADLMENCVNWETEVVSV
jgi:DeoR family glycerol-3-phosphate regulon repressor